MVSTHRAVDTREWSQPIEPLTRGNGTGAKFKAEYVAIKGEYFAAHTLCPFVFANMAEEVRR